MITLPNISTQTAASGNTDASVSSDISPGADSQPQGFVTALSQHLSTLAKQQGSATQIADQTKENDADSKSDSPRDALLAALANPDALNVLLKPENIKADTKSADDKDKQDATTLSASDMQNMQALFAMLPATTTRDASQVASSALIPGDARRSVLSTLSQAVNSALASQHDKPEGKGAKASDAGLVNSTVNATASNSSPAAANNSTMQDLDGNFQQALNGWSKQDDQPAAKDSASDNVLLTGASLSSTRSLATPLNASATTNTPSTPMLNAQLGSNEWQQALSQQIVMFSRNGQQNAELRLHPEDLGSIQISLKLDNDTAQINMVSSHSHVRAALEAALPQLRTALADSGINLGESQVSSDSSAQGQSFQQPQQEARRDGQHGNFSLSQDSDNDITPIAVPAALQARLAGNGAVDTFA